MEEYTKKIKQKLENIQKYFADNKNQTSTNQAKTKQRINLFMVLAIFGVTLTVVIMFLVQQKHSKGKNKDELHEITGDSDTIVLGTDGTKGDIKWRNFLEESIEEEGQKRQEQIALMQESLDSATTAQKEETNQQLDEVNKRLSFVLKEINRLKTDNQNLQNDLSSISGEDAGIMPAELGITSIVDDIATQAPVSSFNYIPATSYVSGNLLGGISVSTSVNTASEPIPVIIKLTSKGNLPADFAVDIQQCRLLASCYGDISSERAVIRAEELVCENKEAGLITSTKVAGVIYGDDGANGIKGSVVSMSDKHLRNAFIGGVLSGFAGTKSGGQDLDISMIGIKTKSKKTSAIVEDGFMAGTSTAAEKLADYHIKLAENISPVILIPGGTKVDVVFTKSVQIGSIDVKDVIKTERNKYSKNNK